LVLAPGASDTIQVTYVVQGSDLPGPLTNVATLTGSYGDCTITAQDSASVELCLPNIDFETDAAGNPLPAGDTVFYDFAAWGIQVTSSDPGQHPPMIFDASNPTGGDLDLGAPNEDFGGPGKGDGGRAGRIGQNDQTLGNILIISEDYDQNDPDDNAGGGALVFTFAQPTDLAYIQLLDVDYGETEGRVRAYDCSDNMLVEKRIMAYGDNSFQNIVIDTTGVCKLVIDLAGSGGLAGIYFCESTPSNHGTIGDFVWYDADGDGVQDAGEAGLANVIVELYDANNHLLATDTTDAQGLYSFPDVMSGDYEVRIRTSTLPAGYIQTYDLDGTLDHSSGVFTLADGQVKDDVDFGYMPDCFDANDISLSKTDPLCAGDSNGSITLTLNGGTPPFSFLWNDGATTQHRSNLPAGTWSVTVTDANNCTIADSITLTDPPALGLSANVTHVSCAGYADGSIDLTVSGGTAPYQYAWSNGATTQDLTGLAAGDYTVTVTDAHGCTASDTWTVTNQAVNPTDGGQIGSDETACGAFDPAPITELSAPSGGSGGTLEYQWQQDTGSGWTDIAGATGATYDPPTISVTTSYRRKVRRSPCAEWQYSNVVVKTVTPQPDAVTDAWTICPSDSLSANVTSNDSNFTSPEVSLVDSTSNGLLVLQANGAFGYRPNDGFCGTDQFTYQLCQTGTACCDTAIVTITV
ncbi:MAG: hypothetical protein D6818_00295, partial [Bacteroidetes bacterium]